MAGLARVLAEAELWLGSGEPDFWLTDVFPKSGDIGYEKSGKLLRLNFEADIFDFGLRVVFQQAFDHLSLLERQFLHHNAIRHENLQHASVEFADLKRSGELGADGGDDRGSHRVFYSDGGITSTAH